MKFCILHKWKTIKRRPYERGLPVTWITQQCTKCSKTKRKMVGPGWP